MPGRFGVVGVEHERVLYLAGFGLAEAAVRQFADEGGLRAVVTRLRHVVEGAVAQQQARAVCASGLDDSLHGVGRREHHVLSASVHHGLARELKVVIRPIRNLLLHNLPYSR